MSSRLSLLLPPRSEDRAGTPLWRSAVSLAALAVLACNRSEPRRSTPESTPAAEHRAAKQRAPTQQAPEQKPKPPLAEPKPGPAYFVLRDVGVVRLTDGRLELFWDTNPKRSVDRPHQGERFGHLPLSHRAPEDFGNYAVFEGLDGRVYNVGTTKVYRFEEDDSVTLVAQWEARESELYCMPFCSFFSGFHVDAKGELWAYSLIKGVVLHVVDGNQERIPIAPVNFEDRPRAALPTGDGGFWVIDDAVRRRSAAGQWSTLSSPRRLRYRELLQSSRGDVFVKTKRTVFALEPPTLRELQFRPGPPSPPVGVRDWFMDMALSSNGALVVGNEDCSIRRVDPDGYTLPWAAELETEGCEKLQAIAVDDARRVWVVSNAGLLVVEHDDVKHLFPSGSLDLLLARVLSLTVVGAGPRLPKPQPLATSTMLLTVSDRNGRVLADTTVEICPAPGYVGGDTPCAGSIASFSGRTDEHGRLLLEDVPINRYEFAALVNGHWQVGEPLTAFPWPPDGHVGRAFGDLLP